MSERYTNWILTTGEGNLAFMFILLTAGALVVGDYLLRRLLPPAVARFYLAVGATLYVATFSRWIFNTL